MTPAEAPRSDAHASAPSGFTAAARIEGRAVVALVLGVLSTFAAIFYGLPAVIIP